MHIPLKPPAPPTLRATPSTPMLRSDSTVATQSQRIPARKSESNLSRAFNTLPPSSHISFSDLLQQSAFSDDDDEEEYGTLDRRGQKSQSHQTHQSTGSPRRLYERFLDSTPGVVRQGDGWSSGFVALPPVKPVMGKQSSMASLRERARMLIHGNHPTSENFSHPHSINPSANNQGTTSSGRTIIDLANKERRNSQPLVHGDRYGTVNSTAAVSFVSTTNRPGTPGAGSVLTTGTGTGGQKRWWKGLKEGLGMKKGKMQVGERMEEVRA
jgi:protein-serine/threonine kinase